MNFSTIKEALLEQIKAIVGPAAVFTDRDDLEDYSHDETEDLRFYPQVLVKPQTPEQISELIKLANQYQIPVTPRGWRNRFERWCVAGSRRLADRDGKVQQNPGN